MTSLLQNFVNISAFKLESLQSHKKYKKPTSIYSLPRTRIASLDHNGFKVRAFGERWSFLGGSRREGVILLEEERWKKKKRVVLVKFNQGFGFNGGGGGRDDGSTARILGNLALAIGLTYLSMTGQLGWLLDAIVSIWLFAVLIPIVGLGAFLWWAGRDMIQGTCPNCGNDFQVFKSSINDDLQLCPFCTQPFSVVGNEFVSDSVKFSNESTTFGQAFNDFSRSKKGKDSSMAVVDVEAEVKDAD